MGLVTDRAYGGSSLSNGSIQLTLTRSMKNDDDKGLAEVMVETGQFHSLHYLVFSSSKDI